MEKIEWLIDKLKRQYDTGASAPAMLTTLQVIQQELTAQTTAEPTIVGKIAVIMPAPQWNTNTDSLLDAYEAESNRGEDEEKVVFELELDPHLEEDEEVLPEPELVSETVPEPIAMPATEPVHAKYISVEMPQQVHAAYVPPVAEPRIEKIAEPVVEKMAESTLPSITPLPVGEVPASIAAVEMPKPVPETDKKSLNDLLEKPAGEMYVRFQEPVRDLKKAMSINDRYQYINNLFSGDEASFDRSIKTINSFNVFSEAEYWIRREVATRYGWEESDQLVQQFYGMVSRRFA